MKKFNHKYRIASTRLQNWGVDWDYCYRGNGLLLVESFIIVIVGTQCIASLQ